MIKKRKDFQKFKFIGISSIIFLLFAPIKAYAQEVTDQKPPQTKSDKALAVVQTVTGIKKVFDPSTTGLQKVIFGSRACCLVSGLTFGYVANKSPIGSKAHAAATACCIGSWNAYGILLVLDKNRLTEKTHGVGK